MKREPQFPLRNLTGAPSHVLLKQPNGFFILSDISHQTGNWLINSLCCCIQFILLARQRFAHVEAKILELQKKI